MGNGDVVVATHCPLGDVAVIWNVFKPNLVVDFVNISNGIVLMLMEYYHVDDKSTPVLVMALCRQATNHYLN